MAAPKAPVLAAKGAAKEAKLEADIFAVEIKPHLVHEAVRAEQNAHRAGTFATKSRGLVAGGRSKPWRQKGTGRARAGMTSSPLWRGGGKIFPNTTLENYSQKVNRRMYRAGMASILSQLAREDRLKVVDEFRVDSPKTKQLAEKVKSMGLDQVLVITDHVDENLWLSSRNLPNVLVLTVQQADPVSLVHFPNVLLTRQAMAKFEEMWA